MTQSPASMATIRALRSALDNAPDSQIMRIVNLVDELDDRQGAEAILAPIRARLRPLRLERPLRFSRLLAIPVDPILVDAARWRPFSASLPRSAIRPLCDVVCTAAPVLAAEVEEMIAGLTTRDTRQLRAAGALLWPRAAVALQHATVPPPSWKAACLPETSFLALTQGMAVCLATAVSLDELGDPTAGAAESDQELSSMLRQAGRNGPTAWSMMLALMFCALPNAQAPRDAALNQGATTSLRAAADAAMHQVWNWIESAGIAAPRDLTEAAISLRQRATVLAALAVNKAQRPRVAALQADLRTAYVRYAADAAQERLVDPIAALSGPPDDDAMMALESEARGLHRLTVEIRSLGEIRGLGGQSPAEATMRQVAASIGACRAIGPVDRARMIELLTDSDAAAKALAAM